MPQRTPTSPVESPSRRKVRKMTAAGFTPREIAAALGISTQAVYGHLARIRDQNGGKAP